MANRRVSLRIRGDGGEIDAPTVEDLLGQVRDFFEILKGVEEAIDAENPAVIEWRVVNATTNSPIRIEVEAFAKQYGVSIERRANVVIAATAAGLSQLRQSAQRPKYFTDQVLRRADSFFERICNGLTETEVDYGNTVAPLLLNKGNAWQAEKNVELILNPTPKAYRELGSVEGFFQKVEEDGWNRPLLWIKHRITGASLKCVVVSEIARQKIANEKIESVWDKRRLMVRGLIHYKALGKISHIDVEDFRILRRREELPSLEDILDEHFTGGIRTEEYLEKLRNGDLH